MAVRHLNTTVQDTKADRKVSHGSLSIMGDVSHEALVGPLAALLGDAPAGFAVLSGNDLVFTYANQAFLRMVNRTSGRVVGRKAIDAFPEAQEQAICALIFKALTSGKTLEATEVPVTFDREGKGEQETRFYNVVIQPRKDKARKVMDIFFMGVEITEQVRARQAAERNAKQFYDILESVADGLVAYDQQWRYVYVSEGAAQMTGLRREEFENKRIHDLFPERVKSASFKEFERVMRGGKATQLEYFSVGANRWLRANLYPNRFGLTSFFTDITENKRFEEMREEFIGVAAHEMKTPVASAKAYAQVLEALFIGKNDAAALELTVKMAEQLDKLARLITNLLDVSKIQGGIMQLRYDTFDLNALVAEVVDELRPTAKHAIVTKLAQPVLVEADRERIRQVIMNFLTNAIKYSPNATRVVVSTAVQGDTIKCHVQDFGIGIEKKDQGRLFERFYRAQGASQETYPGIGLGLYISSAIVAQHGGTCAVKSSKGKGSTFSFSIPMTRASERLRKAAVRRWALPAGQKKQYDR